MPSRRRRVRDDGDWARFGYRDTVAQRALSAICQAIRLPIGPTVHSNVSIGIAHSGADSSVDALLRDADTAMYLAKQSGKGHYEIFQPGMRQEMIDRLEMRVELAEALERSEFVLHYQPIVEVETGRPVGVEALLRWEHRVAGESSRCSSFHWRKRPN